MDDRSQVVSRIQKFWLEYEEKIQEALGILRYLSALAAMANWTGQTC